MRKMLVDINMLIDELRKQTPLAKRLLEYRVFPNIWDDIREYLNDLKTQKRNNLVSQDENLNEIIRIIESVLRQYNQLP